MEKAGLGSLNGEVRAHVKSLNREQREAFMNEALERGDEATLTAILGGMHYLSGFTVIDHSHYVRTYHTRKNPHLVKRLDLMKRFLDEIERNGPIVHTQFDKAVGAKASVVTAIKNADARAMAALKAEPTV